MNNPADDPWQRVQRYLATGQKDAARSELSAIIAYDPNAGAAHLMLGGLDQAEHHPQAAARHILIAARNPPTEPFALTALSGALISVGEIVLARQLLDAPIICASAAVPVLMQAARQRQALGEYATALALIERAQSRGARGADIAFERGMQLLFLGRIDDANADFSRCADAQPGFSRAHLQLAMLRTQTTDHNHLAALAAANRFVRPASEDQALLDFAAYKELEDTGRFDAAWNALARANATMQALLPRELEEESTLIEQLITICERDFLQPVPAEANPGPQPIFVLGLPRSGTTVLERILGNHSQIQSAGELMDFGRAVARAVDHEPQLDSTLLQRITDADWGAVGRMYLAQTRWRAKGHAYYVDKLPRNWMLAGLILKALPQAHVLHLVRDPMDVCFSNWRACLGADYHYAYDLEALAAHWHQHQRLMTHWHRVLPGRILDVDYARLVHDPEGTARAVFEHCGLAFEPNVTDLQRNLTPVATLSAPQVRRAIHTGYFRAWEPYAEQLQPLARALANATKSQ